MMDVIGMHDIVKLRASDSKWDGKTFRVVPGRRRKNIDVVCVETGAKLFGPPHIFELVRKATAEERSEGYAAAVAELDKVRHFVAGMVVTVKPGSVRSSRWSYPAGQRFVVLAVKDLINVTKLGGEGGLYWRLRPESLEIVTAD